MSQYRSCRSTDGADKIAPVSTVSSTKLASIMSPTWVLSAKPSLHTSRTLSRDHRSRQQPHSSSVYGSYKPRADRQSKSSATNGDEMVNRDGSRLPNRKILQLNRQILHRGEPSLALGSCLKLPTSPGHSISMKR